MSSTPIWYRGLITIYLYALLTVILVLTLLIQVAAYTLCYLFGCSRSVRQLVCGHIGHRAVALLCTWPLNPFWRVHWHGLEHIPQQCPRQLLVMCNHASNTDVFLGCRIVPFPWAARYVSKADNFRIPVLGWCMRLAGELPVHFIMSDSGERVREVGQLMAESYRTVHIENIPLVVFPEGRRTGLEDSLLPFRSGYFRFALQHGCSILPVVCTGGNHTWPLVQQYEWLMDRGELHVQYGPVIEVQQKHGDSESVEKLRLEVQAIMHSMLMERRRHLTGTQ